MIVLNTFVAKIGPAGKRNRAARRRLNRRQGDVVVKDNAQVKGPWQPANTKQVVKPIEVFNLSESWDETIARKALALFLQSGKSQRSFSAEHNFPESRLRSWKKKLETLDNN